MAQQAPAPRRPADPALPPPATTDPSAPPTDPTSPTVVPGTPAGTGTLQRPGEAPRDVPLMSIRKEEPRVAVGPVSPETGVDDVLLGSLGIVAVAVIGSLILGAVLGGILVFLKHKLGWGGPDKDADDHISLVDR